MISSAFVIPDFIWARDPVTLQVVLTYNFGDMFFLSFRARPLCRFVFNLLTASYHISFHCSVCSLVPYFLCKSASIFHSVKILTYDSVARRVSRRALS